MVQLNTDTGETRTLIQQSGLSRGLCQASQYCCHFSGVGSESGQCSGLTGGSGGAGVCVCVMVVVGRPALPAWASR